MKRHYKDKNPNELLARIAELEKVKAAAKAYFENWCKDEAEDFWSCLNEQHHAQAKALRDALKSCL